MSDRQIRRLIYGGLACLTVGVAGWCAVVHASVALMEQLP